MRTLTAVILLLAGCFCTLWSIGFIFDSNIIKWCTDLPYGLGLPVWMCIMMAAPLGCLALFFAPALFLLGSKNA